MFKVRQEPMDVDKDCFCRVANPCAVCALFDLNKCTCVHKQGSKSKKLRCVRFGICSR